MNQPHTKRDLRRIKRGLGVPYWPAKAHAAMACSNMLSLLRTHLLGDVFKKLNFLHWYTHIFLKFN